jgi:hypothetical protein
MDGGAPASCPAWLGSVEEVDERRNTKWYIDLDLPKKLLRFNDF